MWQLYLTASRFGQRPSSLIPEITDSWAALQFDNAVGLVGRIIENAAEEMHKVGDTWERKYTMRDLLDPTFCLPTGGAQVTSDVEKLKRLPGIIFDEG